MAESISTTNLDTKDGGFIEIQTVIVPQEVCLVIQVGEDMRTIVRVDQPGNKQAVRRLADAIFEAYRSAQGGLVK